MYFEASFPMVMNLKYKLTSKLGKNHIFFDFLWNSVKLRINFNSNAEIEYSNRKRNKFCSIDVYMAINKLEYLARRSANVKNIFSSFCYPLFLIFSSGIRDDLHYSIRKLVFLYHKNCGMGILEKYSLIIKLYQTYI